MCDCGVLLHPEGNAAVPLVVLARSSEDFGAASEPVEQSQSNLVGDRGLCPPGAGALSQTRSRHPTGIRIVESRPGTQTE